MSAALSAAPNAEFLEQTYQTWKRNPDAVDPTWQSFFAGMEFAGSGRSSGEPGDLRLQTGVVRLTFWHRQAGHLDAHIDPLEEQPPPPNELLKYETYGLTEADLDKKIDASLFNGIDDGATLRELIDALKATYCGKIGVEYMHVEDLNKRSWIAERIEPGRNRPHLDKKNKYRTLMTLLWATHFESFLHTKYVGQKRFSLEGGETLIPMLDALVEKAPSVGIREFVIGMAHRGRLNVLANILHKPFERIFSEFEDNYLPDSTKAGDGDVKYHMGFSGDVKTADGGIVHLSLSPNPSHLEIVNPVVEGRVRAKQRMQGDTDRSRGMPLLIHGDAAFAGQGVVAETLNMANLAGYRTGGTIHIVVNNQIGFTTSPRDARSTQYCTDVAKFTQAPVFHVNAEDPEAAVHVARLAMEYRQEFKSDVVIDLVCYRRYGHNEGDEPAFTQPLDYRKIKSKPPIAEVYLKELLDDGTLSEDEAEAIREEFRSKLDKALKEVKEAAPKPKMMVGFTGVWESLHNDYTHEPVDSSIDGEMADIIANRIATVPEGFHLHKTIQKIMEIRRDNIIDRKSIDWGTAEALAFGSLVLDDYPVRLSGQDSRRGTFSHRHSSYFDQETGERFTPLANFEQQQAPFDAFDSLLSEVAVLGFDYGYSLDDPSSLVLWEAQFGDFANGAQVVIDQFITSGESKWNRASGIVLLLPHGYEGQGPEHSSARLERFLQACAEDNIQVCNYTTPAQFFHALRRQMLRDFRKPLIVMTPKSLLRHPQAISPMSEILEGEFHEVLDDPTQPENVNRVVLCTGKVYYDLLAQRDKSERDGVALIRVEQLYPWPGQQLDSVLKRYRDAEEWVWAQEESYNMGAWFFVEPRFRSMDIDLKFVGRDASASPAAGSHHVHAFEQQELAKAAIGGAIPHYVAGVRKKIPDSQVVPTPPARKPETVGAS